MAEDATDVLTDGPVADGQAQGDNANAEVPFLDIEQYRDYHVPVKVDGVETKVPLAEAIAGYQRQQDYTVKTQDLAAQRQQLQEAAALRAALDQNPQATIDLLMNHYGLSRAQATAVQQAQEDPWNVGSQEQADPRVASLEARLAAIEEERQLNQLQNQLSSLQSKYGPDFDPMEVVTAAMQLGSTDLEGVYKQIAFDRIIAKNSQQSQAQAQAAAELEAKRQAAAVAGGSGAAPVASDAGPILTIADAYRAAKAQLGG